MRIACFLFLLISINPSLGQDFQLIKSLPIDEPTEVSIDRAGNIYYATFNGDIIRVNSKLEDRLIYSPYNPNTINILEAWQGLRVFSFHRDLQQYRLTNRNLSLSEEYTFPPDIINFAEIATPTFDNNLWVIDQVDFSLLKYDITELRLLSRTPLHQLLNPDNYEILYCKEYQNRLFISTRNHGIIIFDIFGSYIKTFDYKGIGFFNFWKDDLYFIEDGKAEILNLYNEEKFSMQLPHGDLWQFILIHGNQTYLFSKNQLALYNKKTR